jgi:C-terminal processing protease CtpA/Prc
MFRTKYFNTAFLFLTLLAPSVFSQIVAEQASPIDIRLDRDRGVSMLNEIKDVIRQRYYDKEFRGINLDEKFKASAEKIKAAEYNGQIFRIIAQTVLDFNDSHTLFYPPARASRVEYGFSLQMIGKKCFVVDVKTGSDAEKKGLKVGDQIVGIGNVAPDRQNLWKINYLLYALDPQDTLDLFVRSAEGAQRGIQITATFKTLKERQKEQEERRKKKKESPFECRDINAELIACKLRTFSAEKKDIDKMMQQVGAHKKMILDLRGNRGGYVKTEIYLTEYFFDKEVKIATFTTRAKTSDRIARGQKEKAYKGELIVLIDSESASAAEVFARVIQIEKRGQIIGDISAGAVMTSNYIPMLNSRGTFSAATFSFYGMSVTIGDVIMSDGKRLESVGVVPDFVIGPTARALNKKSDPVLAYSLEVFGTKITDAEAGQFYFLNPKPEDDDDKETEEGEK